jgi:hypothetical protein
MKTITSKNTWYFIFGFLFILLISLVVYRSMFGSKKNQLDSNSNRDSYINETSEKNSPIEQISPFDEPATGTNSQVADEETENSDESEPNRKRGLAMLPDVIKVSPKPSSNPSPETTSTTDSTKTATKSGDLKVIADQDGTTYLSTQNSDGSVDTTKPRKLEAVGFSFLKLPAGYATDIGTLINDLLRMVMVVAALLVFGQLIWGGINWITSGGDKTKTEAARAKIVAAVVGLIVVASSFAVLQLTLTFLGISSLNELLKTSFQAPISTSQENEGATTSARVIIDGNENNSGSKTKGGL